MNLKLATTVAASLALLAVATGAHAQAPATFTSIPAGDVLLQSLTSTFSGSNQGQAVSGTVYSAVYSNTGGGRDFFYQFTNDLTSTGPITGFSVSDFTAYPGTYFQSTTVDIDGAGPFTTGGVTANNSITSSGTAFFFFSGVGVPTGGKSATLLISTASPTYGTSNAGFLGSATGNGNVLSPVASVVPESGTMALLATGALGLVGMVRRRKVTK